MAITSPQDDAGSSSSPKRLSLGFLVSSLMARCAKHASHISSKLKTANKNSRRAINKSPRNSLGSPLARPKQLLTQISNKAITVMRRRRKVDQENGDVQLGPDEFGDGGVWQKDILMGDKCQPLDFSGVIYYDRRGKQLDEVPVKSPRASPLPAYLIRAT
ncbi:F2P16.13 PROTEIN-RELATED [Salix viminalis]|uniref:F2P16.13 PROTEIN-RELATED n=1 Tax=Salix viminalis TaxID=40686 RepID=A0A6N2LKU9_SALVM|nr:F2P16.13 PROTEIN-RELATED [Salix viminalis]